MIFAKPGILDLRLGAAALFRFSGSVTLLSEGRQCDPVAG